MYLLFYLNATIQQKQLLAEGLVNRDDLNITIENEKDENICRTVFYYKTYVGKIYPIEYPLSLTAVGMYILAEKRILISYTDKAKNCYFSLIVAYTTD